MSPSTDYAPGDRITHLEKPEWGEGTIERAQPVFANGGQAQRLVVRFANHGRVTLNTAFAQLRSISSAADNGHVAPAEPGDDRPAMPTLAGDVDHYGNPDKLAENLTVIPEPARDPFTSIEKRFDYTLNLYRFNKSGRTILDWAVAQSGVNDPLSHLPRIEIEQLFDRFRRNLDQHVQTLVQTLKRSGKQQVIDQGLQHQHPAAREAVKRALAR